MRTFNYKQHALIIVILNVMICGLCYWLLLLPICEQMKMKQRQQKISVSIIKPLLQELPAFHADLLSEAAAIAQQARVNLKLLCYQADDARSIKVIVQADFPTLFRFVEAMFTASFLMNDMMLHLEKATLVTMKASFSGSPWVYYHKQLLPNQKLNNPMKQVDSYFILNEKA